MAQVVNDDVDAKMRRLASGGGNVAPPVGLDALSAEFVAQFLDAVEAILIQEPDLHAKLMAVYKRFGGCQ